VKGVPQELFRPYYLTTNILIETFNRMPDKGVKIFESLNPKEIYYLSHILPQLGESKDYSKDSEKAQREGLFTTLIHFIPKVLDSRPAILLVDDLHFADEATLLLLRRLLLDKVFPLFICATATDTRHDKSEGDPSPLERFYAAYCKDLDIHKVSLTPLTAAHIAEHLRGVFPQLDLPQNFENNLARITQGNPLFLNEIVRKLVMDRKINLVGNQWVIETLAEDYLPESLEQIVSEKIAALDEESRSLLDQASTFGENVSLSMLSGSSEEMEAKVLEFLDQAVDQGLLSSEFQINDETIRFLSKRVLDIAYGAIEEERKQELHERVGSYQEVLFEQHLIPSAATLAYHFKRSTNEEKTGNYEKLQASSNHRLFDATEAVSYSAERATEAAPETSPLNKDSLPLIPAAIRSMLLVVRNLKLYPPGSKAIVSANRQMKEVIDQFLEKNELLSLYSIKNALIVNGQKIDVAEYKYFAQSFLKLLSRFELKGITFKKGLTGQELQILLEAFCRVKNDMIDQHFWQRFLGEQRIVNIELTQVRYTVITDSAGQAQTAQFAAGEDGVAAVDIAAQLEDAEQGMDEHDIRELPEIIRTLLNAARSEQSKLLGKILLRPLEPKAQQLILEDFRSGDPARRQNAAQLLGSARRASLPLLIKLIKREEEFRVRQMAASLLSEYGTQAAKLLKRELALQTTPEEKVRILEILDTVTHDLRTQLAYALADDSDQVRQAALQLAERLNDDQAGKLLLEQTENENVQVAIAAIKFLGKLKPPAANEKLVSILQTAKNEQLVVACCQSLGLIGDPASIDPLAKLLVSKGFFRRKRQSAEVRATAALALSQIDHPRVIQILSSHADDNDPRVRQIANSVIQPTSTHPNGKLATAK
jgi:HEAT repeat protein